MGRGGDVIREAAHTVGGTTGRLAFAPTTVRPLAPNPFSGTGFALGQPWQARQPPSLGRLAPSRETGHHQAYSFTFITNFVIPGPHDPH